MVREPRFLIRLAGAAVALAGTIVTLAVAEKPLSTEARCAFKLLITLLVVLLVYLIFPVADPLVGRLGGAFQRYRRTRQAERELGAWARIWLRLAEVVREAAREGLPVEAEMQAQYRELRQGMQRLTPGFLPDLEQRIRDSVLDGLDTSSLLGLPDIHQEAASADHPFRLFYAEPNVEILIRSLRPNLYSQAAFEVEKDLEELDNLLDRMCDVVREFGASLGIDIDCLR